MLKQLLTIGCALLLPLLSAPATAQANQLGYAGFNLGGNVPLGIQNCMPDAKFMCLQLIEKDWNGRKGDTLVRFHDPRPDKFLGSSVRLMVIHNERKVRGVIATTGGASEQKRLYAELVKRHGKPTQADRRNIDFTRGPSQEYLLARWELPDANICFHGVELPGKEDTKPLNHGFIFYSSSHVRCFS